jgi:membrane-associated protease RseP (regulator of RpoE activity)
MMITKRVFRLADSLILLLLLMTPMMLLLGAAEGHESAPTGLFWLLLLLPVLVLPWILSCCEPEETADGQRAAARNLEHKAAVADQFASLVTPIVRPQRSYVEDGVAIVEGVPRVEASQVFSELERRLAPIQIEPLVEPLDDHAVRVIALPKGVAARLRNGRSAVVNIVLFAATVVTTVYAGARQQGVNLLEDPSQFAVGLPYSLALLAILGVHEFGHYVTARWHGVEVTLPYFIPVPMGLGTFGAFIQMKSLIKSRRAVFDIGIAGPLAGLVVAIPLLYLGLKETPPSELTDPQLGVHAGSSLMLSLMYKLARGSDWADVAVGLSPVAFAAWIGIFITGLNLLPVGQLDGGHIAYGLLGRRRARTVSIAAVLVMAGLGFLGWPGLLTWALLVALIAGFSHMPALDDVTPPDAKRYALGALAFILMILILLPVPGTRRERILDSPYQGRKSLTGSSSPRVWSAPAEGRNGRWAMVQFASARNTPCPALGRRSPSPET